MPKKIFDIFPPQKIREYPQPAVALEKKAEPKQELEIKPPKKRKRVSLSFLKLGWILILVLFIIGGLVLHFVFQRVSILIFPETENLSFQNKVTVDANIGQPDPVSWVENLVLPGKIFEDQKAVEQEFSSSGKTAKEEKARGTVRVYNVYSTSSQTLMATTRFVSGEGKLFRAPQRAAIPGGHYEKGKLEPGFIDIEVVAAEAGESYNIGPSTFSIPGFAGTDKYTAFYGKSFSNMTGGFRGEAFVVSQEDLDRAENVLTEKALKESKDSLLSKIPSDFVLLDNALFQEIISLNFSAEAEERAEKFGGQIQVRSKGLVWKKSDLENFSLEFFKLSAPQGKKILSESVKVGYSAESFNIKSGQTVLNLAMTAKAYFEINETLLKKDIKGKSLEEAKTILENQPQIAKIVIKTFPVWLRTLPGKEGQIKIELRIAP